MTIRRRRKFYAILHFKTSIFLAKNMISALFPSQNPGEIPASGRISENGMLYGDGMPRFQNLLPPGGGECRSQIVFRAPLPPGIFTLSEGTEAIWIF